MDFCDIKINNRLQFEIENDDYSLRNIRGLIFYVGDGFVTVITDFGEMIDIFEDKVLSITKITFDKIVSDSLNELKNHYSEIDGLQRKLDNLKEREPALRVKLQDANFLSKFNIHGAKTRLNNSIPEELLSFKRDNLDYVLKIRTNPDSQVELDIKVFNSFEYYNLDEINDVDKIIRIHAPDVSNLIKSCFKKTKMIDTIESKVAHDRDSIYNVYTTYNLKIDVNKDNFRQTREYIVNSLKSLKSLPEIKKEK